MNWTLQNIIAHASRPGLDVSRYYTRIPAVVTIGSERIEASVIEASGCDMRLEVDELLPCGQVVSVVLMPVAPAPETSLRGVVHWSKTDKYHRAIGVVLDQPVPGDFLASNPQCQRASIRFETDIVAKVLWDHSTVTNCVTILNYSRTGASLQTDTMPVVGESFRLEWAARGRAHMRGCVRWVTGQDNFFLFGCQLLDGVGYAFSGVESGVVSDELSARNSARNG